MAEHATKKPNSSNAEPVEIGVMIFFAAAAAALVLWLGLKMPDIAKWVILGGLGLHALIAVGSSFGEAIPAQAIAQVCELTWQLRGQAAGRQVEGARIGVSANQGLFGHGSSVVVTV